MLNITDEITINSRKIEKALELEHAEEKLKKAAEAYIRGVYLGL
jgi:hypothetical protein